MDIKKLLEIPDDFQVEKSFLATDLQTEKFGTLIAILRTALELKQEEVASYLMLSRITLSKLEHVTDIKKVAEDTLFRISYLATRLVNEKEINFLASIAASRLYKVTNEELNERRKERINDLR